MKRFAALVMLAAATLLAHAQPQQLQPPQQQNITAINSTPTGACSAGSCVVFKFEGQGSAQVQLGASAWTGVGGLTAQATADGVYWVTLSKSTTFTRLACASSCTSATIPSAATNEIYQLSSECTAAYACRITALGAVTGSAAVTVRTSPVSLGGGSATIIGGGDASSANQTSGSQKTQIVDGLGNVVGSTSNALDVNIKSGAGSGGTASNFGSAVPSSGTAAGMSDGTNMQSPRVFDVDSAAGTQYVQGVNLRLSGSGGSVEGGTSANPIRVDPTGSTTQPISATSLPLPTGAATSANQSTSNSSLSSLVTAAGAPADSAAAADNSTASLIALVKRNNQNQTTIAAKLDALNTSVTTDPTSYIGTPGAAAPTKAIQVGYYDGTNLVVPRPDPCMTGVRSYQPININTATTTRIITPTASQKAYFCGMFLFSTGTQNVGIVEGTGGTCGTGTAGIIGGATASTGPNLTAQVGFVLPNTGYAQAATAGTNVDVCLITSAAVQLTGNLVYVKAP